MKARPLALSLVAWGFLMAACGARSSSGGLLPGEEGSGGLPEKGDCCTAHSSPACPDLNVAACVCQDDSSCCTGPWRRDCVESVSRLGCANCASAGGSGGGGSGGGGSGGARSGGGPTSGGALPSGGGGIGGAAPSGGFPSLGGGAGASSCCEPHLSVGCDDPFVTRCACAFDRFCCSGAWDETCVATAETYCGAPCGSGGTGSGGGSGGSLGGSSGGVAGSVGGSGPSGGQPNDESCCSVHRTPGCESNRIASCVCDPRLGNNPGCCAGPWDESCVGTATLCGAGCGARGSCCSDHGTPGCDEPMLESCVCSFDSYCCTSRWDQRCVAETELCSDACGIGGSVGGSAGVGGAWASGGNPSGGAIMAAGGSGPTCRQVLGSACNDCVCDRCAATFESCAENPSCVRLVECVIASQCGDLLNCVTQCGGSADLGAITLAATLASCAANNGCSCP